MNPETRAIAESFDARAATYARNDWHRRSAERLVDLCSPRRGSRVLDAGTGTGFAALAAARRVGADGYVCGVDVSAGMLREGRVAAKASGLTNVALVQADACSLPCVSDAFDVVLCATALLYIPVAPALREWHRVSTRGGALAFSTMQSGSPPPARLFRACAAELGVLLKDPWEPLGSRANCVDALEAAGFQVVGVVTEPIDFSASDLALAWDSNVRSLAHPEIQRLTDAERRALRERYLARLAREERDNPAGLHRADMLYAIGRR